MADRTQPTDGILTLLTLFHLAPMGTDADAIFIIRHPLHPIARKGARHGFAVLLMARPFERARG